MIPTDSSRSAMWARAAASCASQVAMGVVSESTTSIASMKPSHSSCVIQAWPLAPLFGLPVL